MQPLLYYFRFLFLGAFVLLLLRVGALLTDGATEREGKLCGEREGRLDGMDDGDEVGAEFGTGVDAVGGAEVGTEVDAVGGAEVGTGVIGATGTGVVVGAGVGVGEVLGVEKGDGLTEGDELDGCDEVFPGSASLLVAFTLIPHESPLAVTSSSYVKFQYSNWLARILPDIFVRFAVRFGAGAVLLFTATPSSEQDWSVSFKTSEQVLFSFWSLLLLFVENKYCEHVGQPEMPSRNEFKSSTYSIKVVKVGFFAEGTMMIFCVSSTSAIVPLFESSSSRG